MRKLIQVNRVAFSYDDTRWIGNGILKINVYEEDFEYMTPVIQPYPRNATKPWAELHNPELSSLPVTIIFTQAKNRAILWSSDNSKEWERVAVQCHKDNQLCVTDQAIEQLLIESVMLYLWHEFDKAETRVNHKLMCNNEVCRGSVMQTIMRQGVENLIDIGITNETIGLVFKHIFIGVEHDGYAHS